MMGTSSVASSIERILRIESNWKFYAMVTYYAWSPDILSNFILEIFEWKKQKQKTKQILHFIEVVNPIKNDCFVCCHFLSMKIFIKLLSKIVIFVNITTIDRISSNLSFMTKKIICVFINCSTYLLLPPNSRYKYNTQINMNIFAKRTTCKWVFMISALTTVRMKGTNEIEP